MNDANSHDPQSAARAVPSPRYTYYRLLVVSVRGHKYLLGNTTVHPVAEIPPGVGMHFSSTFSAQHHVCRHLVGLSCYYAVEIINDDGQTVMRGARSGFNGTGNTWIWRDTRPGDAPAPA